MIWKLAATLSDLFTGIKSHVTVERKRKRKRNNINPPLSKNVSAVMCQEISEDCQHELSTGLQAHKMQYSTGIL